MNHIVDALSELAPYRLYSTVPVKVPMEMGNSRLETALPFSAKWGKSRYASIHISSITQLMVHALRL